MTKNKTIPLILGLAVIVVIYSLYSVFLTTTVYLQHTPRLVKVGLKLFCIVLIYLSGYFSIRNYGTKWVRDIWNLIYFITTAILILFSLFNWLFDPSSLPLRNLAKAFDEFLISPLLFIAIVIISQVFVRMKESNADFTKK